MPKWEGMYRMRGASGHPDVVVVSDGDITFDNDPITETEYHRLLAEPPLDKLPWSNRTWPPPANP